MFHAFRPSLNIWALNIPPLRALRVSVVRHDCVVRPAGLVNRARSVLQAAVGAEFRERARNVWRQRGGDLKRLSASRVQQGNPLGVERLAG